VGSGGARGNAGPGRGVRIDPAIDWTAEIALGECCRAESQYGRECCCCDFHAVSLALITGLNNGNLFTVPEKQQVALFTFSRAPVITAKLGNDASAQ
jgi:hypothetical protein